MKSSLADLARWGGRPEFPEPLHVGRPNIPDVDRTLERLRGVLERRILTNDGPLVREFEAEVARRCGTNHCIAVANGTLGLEIAARALGFQHEVIVPAYTFVATAHALQWQQIAPVFADVDPETHQLDPGDAEARLTPRTTGLLPVHLWGRTCDIDALLELGARRRLPVLFDGSHAFGATYKGRPVGGFGAATVFSFHATKFVNCFEGGAIVTQDDSLARRLRFMRNFGFAGYDQVDELGVNAKMSEASAAMGLSSLEAVEQYIAVNRRNLAAYARGLSDLPGVKLLPRDDREQDNFQYVVAEINVARAPLTRDELLDLLWAENVRVRRYFYPGCHNMAPYRDGPPPNPPLPNTDRLCREVLLFPTGSAMDVGDIVRVCGLIRWCWEHAEAIRARLKAEAAAK